MNDNAKPAMTWPEIVSFDVLDVPDFPTQALPDVLREWVEAESYATQTPADLAGLLALAVCSATIARRVEVEARPGWWEPVNLFAAVLLEPGNRKSAVFTDCLKPLREIESELIECERPTVARAQSERRQLESRLKRAEKRAAEKGDEEAGRLSEELATTPEPILPRLLVDDVTSEHLETMLAEQGGRLASMSPEGGPFDLMAGKYSKKGDTNFVVYLKGHAGDDIVTDRMGRKSVRVKRPALTCGYAVQPQVIRSVASDPAFRGRGLLARFLYAAPKSWIGQRLIAPAPVSEATREAYHRAVRTLAESFGNIGSASEPFVLQLAADAARLLRDWEAEIEAMLGDGGQMEVIRDWGGKLAGLTLRLAAAIHCVQHGPSGDIDADTLTRAIEIGRYAIPHAESVLGLAEARESLADDDARYVLRWIERHGRREFTKSEAQHHGKRRFPKADDIDAALADLIRRGYIRPKPAETSRPGRPPSPAYEVNPATFADAKLEKRSHNSHNSPGEPENGGFGNIGSAFCQGENENVGAVGDAEESINDINAVLADAAAEAEFELWGTA